MIILKHNFKTVCFDYYGTLVDIGKPFDSIKEWLKEYLVHKGASIDINKFYLKFTKKRAVLMTDLNFRTGYQILNECFEYACKSYNVPLDIKPFSDYIDNLFISAEAFEDSHYIIEQLKKYYKVGLITNADNNVLNASIKKQGFCFDFIVSSETARCNKPDRGIFNYAMELLQMENSDFIMVGDSEFDDVYSVASLGGSAIWVNRSNSSPKINSYDFNNQIYEVCKLREITRILC